ncbi:MAG TPA: glycerate kinase [Deltaproteobacteria bacterium]|nr:glycerate kinase [Deltaproteobacteria bacterium]
MAGRRKISPRAAARAVFREALKAADPVKAVKAALSLVKARGRTRLRAGRYSYDLDSIEGVYCIGAGKAAAAMAAAVEGVLGRRVAGGLVVTKYGHGRPTRRIEVVEAAHPIPDEAGLAGARRMMEIARKAGARDLVICLVSGGASALAPAPLPGVTLAHKQAMTELLVRSGADIYEINAVRKHLSVIKGGGLARLIAPARTLALVISDVVGDDLSTIASGPVSPDETTCADCLAVLERYGIAERAPRAVLDGLRSGRFETPKPGDPIFDGVRALLVATNRSALAAAARRAGSLGLRPVVLTSTITGETHEAARFLVAVAREALSSGNPARPPACILMGGETTLRVTGGGLGGRNQEFALTAALELDGIDGVTVLSAGTDGTDGPTDAAGAFADGATLVRARAAGLDAAGHLARNDSYRFFDTLGDLLRTGPTGTNVMDVMMAVVGR